MYNSATNKFYEPSAYPPGSVSVQSIMTGTSEFSLLADIMWHEAGPPYVGDTVTSLRNEQMIIGTAMMNRLAIEEGTLVGYDDNGRRLGAANYAFGNTLREVILNAGGNDLDWGIFRNGRFTTTGRAATDLRTALDTQVTIAAGAPFAGECAAVVNAIWGAVDILGGARVQLPGGIALAWNSKSNGFTDPSTRGFNREYVNLGYSGKIAGNVFFGIYNAPPVVDGGIRGGGRGSPIPPPRNPGGR
jgi:hypothetical protein